jgi:hypothetical protein
MREGFMEEEPLFEGTDRIYRIVLDLREYTKEEEQCFGVTILD